MVQNYSEIFKMKCVAKLELLKELGTINIEGVQIKNVRELVAFLEISSYSLYKWQKALKYKGEDLEEIKNEISDDMSEKVETRVKCAKEGFCKAYQSDFDEGYGNCNMLGECDDYRTDFKGFEKNLLEEIDEVINGESNAFLDEMYEKHEPKQDIFGIRYFAWFGRTLGIKGYNKMPLAQLKLKIGIKLIKESGLINNDKVIEALRLEGILK